MRRWTGDRFVGVLEAGETPPLMDVAADEHRQSEVDQVYVAAGVVSIDEARASRFSGAKYAEDLL